jgi:hypothetical protein
MIKQQLVGLFQKASDSITQIFSLRDYLSSKLEDQIEYRDVLTDLASRSVTDFDNAIAIVQNQIDDDWNFAVQMPDVSLENTDQLQTYWVNGVELAVAVMEGADTIKDKATGTFTLDVDQVIEHMNDQLVAVKCGIELLSTFAENTVQGKIAEGKNLINDYHARLKLTIGEVNENILAATQQMIGLLTNASMSVKDRLQSLLSFFGFNKLGNVEWDGTIQSDFTDITGVSAMHAFWSGIGNWVDIVRKVGDTIKNVVAGFAWSLIGVAGAGAEYVKDTLTGEYDAYSPSIISIGKDASFDTFGTTIQSERESKNFGPEWVADPRTLNDIASNFWLMVKRINPGYSWPDKPTSIKDKISIALDAMISEGNNRYRDLEDYLDYFNIQTNTITGLLMLTIAVRKRYAVLNRTMNGPYSSYTSDRLFGYYIRREVMESIHRLLPFNRISNFPEGDSFTDDDVSDFISEPHSNGIVESLLVEIMRDASNQDDSFSDAIAMKLSDRHYIKFRLFGAYLYAWRTPTNVQFHFRWIPIDPEYLSFEGFGLVHPHIGNMTSLSLARVRASNDGSNTPVVRLDTSNPNFSDFSDRDFGHPSNDEKMVQWILNAKMLTAYQLALLVRDSKDQSIDEVNVSTMVELLTTLSGLNSSFGYGPRNNSAGNPEYLYFSSNAVSSGHSLKYNNLQLAGFLTGFLPESHDKTLKSSPALEIALSSLLGHIADNSDESGLSFIPYHRVPTITRGSYHVRTDTQNRIIAAIAISLVITAISIVTIKVAAMWAKKRAFRAKLAASYASRQELTNENIKIAWKTQRKADRISKLASALNSTASAAVSSGIDLANSSIYASVQEQIHQTLGLSTSIPIATVDPIATLLNRLIRGQ